MINNFNIEVVCINIFKFKTVLRKIMSGMSMRLFSRDTIKDWHGSIQSKLESAELNPLICSADRACRLALKTNSSENVIYLTRSELESICSALVK